VGRKQLAGTTVHLFRQPLLAALTFSFLIAIGGLVVRWIMLALTRKQFLRGFAEGREAGAHEADFLWQRAALHGDPVMMNDAIYFIRRLVPDDDGWLADGASQPTSPPAQEPGIRSQESETKSFDSLFAVAPHGLPVRPYCASGVKQCGRRADVADVR
jgi:hypothetical protein